jgi:hypothetical protein
LIFLEILPKGFRAEVNVITIRKFRLQLRNVPMTLITPKSQLKKHIPPPTPSKHGAKPFLARADKHIVTGTLRVGTTLLGTHQVNRPV